MSDGLVKTQNPYFSFGLRCIHRNSMVRQVQIITQDSRALPILIRMVSFSLPFKYEFYEILNV